MDFGMLIEVKTELIQGSIDLNIIGTDSHRAPPVSFLTCFGRWGNVNRKTEKDLYALFDMDEHKLKRVCSP